MISARATYAGRGPAARLGRGGPRPPAAGGARAHRPPGRRAHLAVLAAALAGAWTLAAEARAAPAAAGGEEGARAVARAESSDVPAGAGPGGERAAASEPREEAEILSDLERRGPPAPADVDGDVAALLLERARGLYARGDLDMARRLALEAVFRAPESAVAEEAAGFLATVNERLGYRDPYAGLRGDGAAVREGAGVASGPGAHDATERDPRATELAAATYGAAYGGFGGVAFVGAQSRDGGVRTGAIAVGALGAGAGGALGYYLSRRYDLTGAQVASVAVGGTWGSLTGGFLGHVLTGIDSGHPNQIVGSAGLGGLVGSAAGAAYGLYRDPAPEEVHLASSLAAYGTAAALFLGVAMEPPTREAYSLNGAVGGAAGLGAGLAIAERWGTPSRRQLVWADAGAAIGVAGSWLFVYPMTGSARATGAVSVAALAGGALGGLRLGRGEEGGAEGDGAPSAAAPALLERTAGGGWRRGAPIPSPVGATSDGASLGLTVLSGEF